MNQALSEILMSIQVIIDSPKSLDADRFLAVCRQDLPSAFKLLDAASIHFFDVENKSPELASALLTIDWEHLGATEFIRRHSLNLSLSQASRHSRFLAARIRESPAEIQDADLWQLRRQFAIDTDLLAAVNERMAAKVNLFADRIINGPMQISGDLQSLKKSIQRYGFSSELDEVLDEIDRELEQPASAFDQVGTMQHIRSFYEKLHLHIGEELRRRKPSTTDRTPLNKCGQAIEFLCRKDVITEKVQAFAKSIYGILSDSGFGCHALKATRDYTRLCRNVVVEYAVTLFLELERRLAEPGN